jgi:hypothetical protein
MLDGYSYLLNRNKMKRIILLIAVLLGTGCKKAARWNVASVAVIENNNKAIAPSNRYDRTRLQTLLDSLQRIDSRNSILTQARTCDYIVYIYGVYGDDDYINSDENGNLRFHTGSMKNWLFTHALNIARAVSACSYNYDTGIGIKYVSHDGRIYFCPIINFSWPNPFISTLALDRGSLPGGDF